MRVDAQEFEALGGAVIDDQHIAHDVFRDAGRDRQRTPLAIRRLTPRTSTSSLIPWNPPQVAMRVRPVTVRARRTAARISFGTGVGERGALGARQFAQQRGDLDRRRAFAGRPRRRV